MRDRPSGAVVPFAAGSATDQIGRAFADKMSQTLGQPIVVDNKPGASGKLGTPEALAQRSRVETAKCEKAIRDAKIEPQ